MSISKTKVAVFFVMALLYSLQHCEYIYGEEEGRKDIINIVSDTMEADSDRKLITFSGNVVAREDFMVCSDRLYIHYTGRDEIKQMIAEGDVRIVQDKKGAKGDRAVYDRDERIMVITGSAEAIECGDVIRGDRITLYLDTDDVLVEGGGNERVRATIMPEKKECKEVDAGEVLGCP